MGIHVHVKGQPDMCGCCALVDRLNELWNRTHNSVLSVNGVYADGNGSVVIPGIEDISDLREQIADDRQYIEAIADDLVQNYATKAALQGVSNDLGTTQTQLSNLAGEIQTNYASKEWVNTKAPTQSGVTPFSLGDAFAPGSTGGYTIKNGICYISIWSQMITGSPGTVYTVNMTDLPKAAITVLNDFFIDNTGQPLAEVYIATNTENHAWLQIISYDTNHPLFAAISYPIE